MRKILSDCHPSFSQENVKGSSNYKINKSGRSLDLAYQLGAMTIKGLTHPAPSYIRGGVMGIIAMTIIGLFSFNAYAECTPTPDCASIGYTETSCEGDSLKCPFDITKLYCIPCDSSFKYTCSGDNIAGGTGSACGGKYVACTCASGFSFENGECKCPASITTTICNVGAIYYPDGKCSNDYVACLNPVGVVVKDNALVMSWRNSSTIQWGTYGTDVDTLTNITSTANAKADYNGKDNTALLVAFQTTEGKTASNSAAIYCNELAPTGMESSKGQWYLPAAGELYSYVYGNYNSKLKATATKLGWDIAYAFWSSSEYSSRFAWYVRSLDGSMGDRYEKNYTRSVSCFLAINQHRQTIRCGLWASHFPRFIVKKQIFTKKSEFEVSRAILTARKILVQIELILQKREEWFRQSKKQSGQNSSVYRNT